MKIIRVHKIRLRPMPEQASHLFRACKAARDAYNWGLEQLNLEYDINQQLYQDFSIATNGFSHARQLKKLYNQIKDKELTSNTGTATQEAFDDLQRSIQRFWDIQTGKIVMPKPKKPRKGGKSQGWPKWRNRFKHNSFRCTYVSLQIDGKFITYNRIVGPIRMCEELRFEGNIRNAIFSWDGIWWWASIQVAIEFGQADSGPNPNNDTVGVDLGVSYLATTSDGEVIDNPKALYAAQKKLRRLQRKLDRQRRANNPEYFNDDGTIKPGPKDWIESKRMKRTRRKITKAHQRVKNIRQDKKHKNTRSIAKNYGVICLEDLNVRGMLQNGKLAKAISDAAFYETRRQLEYKAEEHGGIVVVVDRWFPSSKRCYNCGWINGKLKLLERRWVCPECGNDNHREGNAALNIRDEGLKILYGNNEYPQVRGVTDGC